MYQCKFGACDNPEGFLSAVSMMHLHFYYHHPFYLHVFGPLSPRALAAEMRDVASFLHHSLHIKAPSCYLLPYCSITSRRDDIPEADTPPWKRLLLTTSRPECEVGESSAAAAARQPGPTMAHRVNYSLTLQREMIPLQGLVTTLQGQVTALQGQVMALQGQVTALQGQQGPAGGPAQPELPEEAGSSS
ncbi:hypothetical protein Tco_0892913 [Tanacetum coccineum]|uniref:Uncharacterized protein n=1 Tax=Tanacetum coccineum TaxID=301880 RepID=A0ABQ5C7H5_9ASTR